MDSSYIEQLLADCSSCNLEKQVSAISELQNLKVYSAVPILLELLSSREGNIRSLAVEALGWLGQYDFQEVGHNLIEMLADSEALVRDEAVNAIARLNYTPAIRSIHSILLDDSDWIVRASAAEALGDLAEVGDSETLKVLELTLDDPVESVRAYAACSIGIIGTSASLPKLQPYRISEESLHTRAEILIAMYRLGEREGIKTFLQLLDEADELLVEVILNILEDLATRRVPEYFPYDVPCIREILLNTIQVFPNQKNHIEEIAKLLESLEDLS